MKTIHLVAPRTGPDNAGDADCIVCGVAIFNAGGSLAYDQTAQVHTTDAETFESADFIPCGAARMDLRKPID